MENNYPVIIAVILLLVFLLYKEARRANRARLFLRIAAVVFAVGALAFLFFPPSYKTVQSRDGERLLLLTEGADNSSLQSGNYYTTDSSVLSKRSVRGVKYIPDLAYYLQQHQDLAGVSLYGNGLEPADLKSLNGYTYDFHPAQAPLGLLSCSWPGVLKQAELLRVEGVFNNTGEGPAKLLLEGLGSGLDSVIIPAHTSSTFSLKTLPRQLGRAVYNLIALTGNDTLQNEKIPFQVSESPKVKLLVLSSFPDFEYKFLKSWLFEHGYQVVFRTRISKDKFSTDQLNTTTLNAETINAATLAKFDGVIADDEELSALNPAAMAGLRSAINQGLGLVVRMNDIKTLSLPASQFKIYEAGDSTIKFFTPVLTGETAKLKPLPLTQDIYIRANTSEQQLVKARDGKVLLSTRIAGNGKITGSVISSTYQWMLGGHPDDYALFWSAVIGNTVRKQEKDNSWRTVPAIPVKGKPVRLIYQAATTAAPVIDVDSANLNPLQNTLIPYRWAGDFWPQHTGWNQVKINSNPLEYLFVYEKNDWESVRQYQKLIDNISYAKKHASKVSNPKVKLENIEKEVSKWWFYALFLLSVGYMWFETKLL